MLPKRSGPALHNQSYLSQIVQSYWLGRQLSGLFVLLSLQVERNQILKLSLFIRQVMAHICMSFNNGSI